MSEKTAIHELRPMPSWVRLCVIVDGGDSAEACGRLVSAVAAAGADMIQLRAPALDDARLFERAVAAVAAARSHAALLIVNDRPDVAVAAGADGVHVGERDLPVEATRRVVGPDRLVGRTAHSFDEAARALGDGADYLGVGPCFSSQTKPFDSFASPSFLRRVAADIPLPSFAIGGITPSRVSDVLATGITRVAVAASITTAADPAAAVRQFVTSLGPCDRSRGAATIRRSGR